MALQDYDWMTDEFLPRLLESPLQKVAVLESIHELEQLSLRHMVYASYMAFSFKLKYVDDLAAALTWFSKKNFKGSVFTTPEGSFSPAL